MISLEMDHSSHSSFQKYEESKAPASPSPTPSFCSTASSSSSSTFATHYTEKTRRTSRKVRFNERRNERIASDKTDEDVDASWYTDKDFKRFRVNARRAIAEARKGAEQSLKKNMFIIILEDLYEAVSAVNFVLHDASKILTEEQQHNLSNLFQDSDNVDILGLEFHLVQKIKVMAEQTRDDVQEVVADIQDEYKRGLWTSDQVSQELRDSCLNFSQSSVLFSQLLAKAQLGAQ